ncbi:MAG: DNA polymerase III subunit alpha, partial [Lachnospiraceae bacterium]|nr:DNA polymerase III subunit alpha [Lachnospiraceae bacterium]
DFIPKYIKGKNNHEDITYLCPELEPILSPTYGCIVYQEQVMQIVRDLGGYTLGRSDLVRRAMSKKKQHVMEVERENFVHGNAEENVPGCVSKGIDEKVASEIYDEMMDFAKYAFNKSHAACYAVVAYQTAYLKYYYPVEFMAALITSVIDNAKKVSEYILVCRNMGIQILPPDINEGESGFSVQNGAIRYALTAIKGVGRNIIDAVVEERNQRGRFTTIRDFLTRMKDTELNKRNVENFIKAGALDSLEGTRKQFMTVYARFMDDIAQTGKNTLTGQISLFDVVDDEAKKDFEIRMPEVGEYPKEMMLAFEKEVLGIYISGHPMEAYMGIWNKYKTASSADFLLDEETGATSLMENESKTIGGIIAAKTVKYTKNDKIMAFLTIEDILGTVEVIVFPKQYDIFGQYLNEDAKVFITGRVSLEDEKDGRLILEKLTPFEKIPRNLWIRFKNKADYEEKMAKLSDILKDSEGIDKVNIYLDEEKQMRSLSRSQDVRADEELMEALRGAFGEDSVKLV